MFQRLQEFSMNFFSMNENSKRKIEWKQIPWKENSRNPKIPGKKLIPWKEKFHEEKFQWKKNPSLKISWHGDSMKENSMLENHLVENSMKSSAVSGFQMNSLHFVIVLKSFIQFHESFNGFCEISLKLSKVWTFWRYVKGGMYEYLDGMLRKT